MNPQEPSENVQHSESAGPRVPPDSKTKSALNPSLRDGPWRMFVTHLRPKSKNKHEHINSQRECRASEMQR